MVTLKIPQLSCPKWRPQGSIHPKMGTQSFILAKHCLPFLTITITICVNQSRFKLFCDTLLRRSNIIFSTIESADPWIFICIIDVSFSCKMLLKLIHFKSLNRGVTWSLFKYFLLLATFAAKFIYFCTSYYSFSLHLPILNYNSLNERR